MHVARRANASRARYHSYRYPFWLDCAFEALLLYRREMAPLNSSQYIALLLLCCAGCNKTTARKHYDAPAARSAAAPGLVTPEVTVHGSLREIMHMGRTNRRVDLAPTIGEAHLYGLGALEALSGEITVWSGELWLGTPDGRGSAFSGRQVRTTSGATLLVTSKVARWREQPIEHAIPFNQLDTFIEGEARAAGVNVTEAFPFRIEGSPTRLDWHVIDGKKIPNDAHGHEAHMQTAVRGSLVGAPVRILGFYSPKHHAIFTHHDTNTHAHVICDEPAVTGHIDHLEISAGMKLFFPER